MFLDPLMWLEVSYELGSVHPSVLPVLSFHPSVLPYWSFLGIGSLIFSETQHVVWGPCVVSDRARFFEKNPFAQKMGKMGQKWAKIGFLHLLENLVINFFWIWSAMKVYLFAKFLHKSHIWEKSGSCDMGQNAPLLVRLHDFWIN